MALRRRFTPHSLTVDAVQDGLEIVAFSRVLRVKHLDEFRAKGGVNKSLGGLRLHLHTGSASGLEQEEGCGNDDGRGILTSGETIKRRRNS